MCAVGYDNLPTNFEQVLSLPMREATGLVTEPTQDVARPHHTAVLGSGGPPVINAPTWVQHAVSNLTYLVFAATQACSIGAGATVTPADMNFGTGRITGGFSFAVWFLTTDLTAVNNILCYGENTVGVGYEINIDAAGGGHFLSWQGGPASQDTFTAAAVFPINIWWFLAVTFGGTWGAADQALIYRNAIDVTDTQATHVSPADPVARDFYIAAHDDGVAAPGDAELCLIGNMWNLRCWTRQLPQIEIWELFEMERALFQV